MQLCINICTVAKLLNGGSDNLEWKPAGNMTVPEQSKVTFYALLGDLDDPQDSSVFTVRGLWAPKNGKVVSAVVPKCQGEAEKWIYWSNFFYCLQNSIKHHQHVLWHYTGHFLRMFHKTRWTAVMCLVLFVCSNTLTWDMTLGGM